MTRRFDGRVALITAASRGIGAATARLFAQQGQQWSFTISLIIPSLAWEHRLLFRRYRREKMPPGILSDFVEATAKQFNIPGVAIGAWADCKAVVQEI